MSLAERRRCVSYLRNAYEISERHACQAMQMNRGTYRYVAQPTMDTAYRRVVELSHQHAHWGYRKIYDLIKGETVGIGRERVRLIRRHEGLQLVRPKRKVKRLGTTTQWVHRAQYPNHVWSYDFVADQTDDKRRLKCLTVIDEFSRRALAVDIGRSFTAQDVMTVLKRLTERYGKPAYLRSDNGPEFVSKAVRDWLAQRRVETHFIDPGSPWQNSYNESFNSILRMTCLNRWVFSSLTEARVIVKQWLDEYNNIRPHGSLRGQSPEQFLRHYNETKSVNQPKRLTA